MISVSLASNQRFKSQRLGEERLPAKVAVSIDSGAALPPAVQGVPR